MVISPLLNSSRSRNVSSRQMRLTHSPGADRAGQVGLVEPQIDDVALACLKFAAKMIVVEQDNVQQSAGSVKLERSIRHRQPSSAPYPTAGE